MNNKATNISSGQQERASIAGVLINNPRIILGNEPAGNLDSETTEIVYSLFSETNQKFESSFIVITHDKCVAEKVDGIFKITDGKINMSIKIKSLYFD